MCLKLACVFDVKVITLNFEKSHPRHGTIQA